MFKLDFFFENFYNLSLCNIRVQLEATERAPRKFKKMADGSLSLSFREEEWGERQNCIVLERAVCHRNHGPGDLALAICQVNSESRNCKLTVRLFSARYVISPLTQTVGGEIAYVAARIPRLLY